MSYPIPAEELEACVVPQTEDTKDFFYHHVNYRVRDPKVTIKFYSEMFGMRLVQIVDVPQFRSSLYFMGYGDDLPKATEISWDCVVKMRTGLIEFLYHWGSEKVPDYKYCSGNEPGGKGFSHICVRVPDPAVSFQRLESKGVSIVKHTNEGAVHGYGYVKDPDGYWVELLGERLTIHEGAKESKVQLDAFNY